MRKLIGIVTGCFMIISLFSGCTLLEKTGLQGGDNDKLHPVSSIVMNEEEAKKLTDKVPIHLYFSNQENTGLKLEIRYIPVSEAKKSINNLAAVIVKELVKGPGANSNLKATIPVGAQLRSQVVISAGVATVDFNKEFVDKHPGGKAAEQLTIYSIVNSLTELKEIQKVRFTINGKSQKEFKGNFQFDALFPRSASLIQKDAPPQASGTTTPLKDDKKKDTPQSDQKKNLDNTDSTKAMDGNSDIAGGTDAIYTEILE